MKPQDRKAFAEVVIAFAELKGKQLSAPAIELYWRAMEHWTLENFKAAAEQLLRTCEFMPLPADFEKLRRACDLTAGEAWELALHGRATKGSRAERAARIASNGRYLGHMDIERELPHVQRRFLQIYDELTDVETVREALPNFAEEGTARIRHDGFRRLPAPGIER